jgi:hypothetical protein
VAVVVDPDIVLTEHQAEPVAAEVELLDQPVAVVV